MFTSLAGRGGDDDDLMPFNRPPEIELEDGWAELSQGFERFIDSVQSESYTFELDEFTRLNGIVYKLCTRSVDPLMGRDHIRSVLYERFKNQMDAYLRERVLPSLRTIGKAHLLHHTVKTWNDHRLIVRYMTKVYDYLDRFYTKHARRDSLRTVGLRAFKRHVYEGVKGNLATALLELVHQERIGNAIDRNMVKDGVLLFVDMGLGKVDTAENLRPYKMDFERALLSRTQEYYDFQSQIWMAENDISDYMKIAERKILEEERRASTLLHSSSETTIVNTAQHQLVAAQLCRVVRDKGAFTALLRDAMDRKEDLGRMFRLMKRVSQQGGMAEEMRDFVTGELREIRHRFQLDVEEAEEAGEENEAEAEDREPSSSELRMYVEMLVAAHDMYYGLVRIEFENDKLFQETVSDAFRNIINKSIRVSRSGSGQTRTFSELLAGYVDHVMLTSRRIGEDRLDGLLDEIVRMLGYIQDRDIFVKYCRRLLSRRLLAPGAATNLDAERSLITKLKLRYQASFTRQLEGMLKDHTTAAELQREYEEEYGSRAHPGAAAGGDAQIKFVPSVLTKGFWPRFNIVELHLPVQLGECVDSFASFWKSRQESRKLVWVHELGRCIVRGSFASGPYIVSLSTIQACILLCFNPQAGDRDADPQITMQAGELQKALNIPFKMIQNEVAPFYLVRKVRFLKRVASSRRKVAQETDQFSLNLSFQNPSTRLRVPPCQITSDERQALDKELDDDRKMVVDAAIVRLMKARRTMTFQLLVTEVITQLATLFRPSPSLIKRRCEECITQGYLERHPRKKGSYNYKA